ncbi:MAG: UDP-N-acetylglucosamine 2-epimerase (non-hydrolyzing) [Muribaculaceae bacterium]|nr:UDP-N-acetylglucosamine 2-epimerase (non-hydrolyzing) [Muribaculaceae bacterium]
MKIVTVIGARPQFIKAAVVNRAIAQTNGIEEVIVHTGQHFDTNMSDVFFEEMAIPKPQYNLNINGLGHGAMTGQMLEKIEEVLIKEKPDWVLVYGDTNSTIAGALAAKKLHIKVAHVEAGLRSFNIDMPEEINRILTDRISDILFCPTTTAVNNLKKEGYENIDCQIKETGDVMQDAALFYAEKAKKPTVEIPNAFALCTVHRAENTDNPTRLRNIFSALEAISKKTPVVLPLHPRTKAKLTAIGYDFENSAIHFISPVGYLEMVWLLSNCKFVLTDSGGLQKEAYFFSKPCITMRDETEWVELVENGFNKLAGADTERIIELAQQVSNNLNLDFTLRLYGNGDAGEMIIKCLK